MSLARNYLKPLADGLKIHPSDILGGMGTMGNIYYVVPSTEANYNVLKGIYGFTYDDGSEAFCSTVAEAYGKTVSGRDDVIVLALNVSHQLTEMLTVSKNRVHFVGDTFGRIYGQRAKINYADAIDTADPFAVKVTGVGCTFEGIKFINNNTDAQVVGTVGEGGEYTVYRNCEFYNSTNLTSDTVAELVLGGDSAQFFNCTFGSLADAVTGDKIRPAVLVDGSVVGDGKVARDILFDGCKFWKKAGGTATVFIKVAADADLERVMEIKDCTFVANKLGSVPAVAIALGASLTNSQILLTGNTIACNCTKIATGTGVINGTPARVATATIGIQAT